MFPRFVQWRINEALADTPVILLEGPRRVGKTTLVRKMAGASRPYLTLDDRATLEAARSDPEGFIQRIDQAVIDEVQRAPELLLAIKKSVDEHYRPGRFLLTGSANVLTLPRVADSLAGRMEILQLLPLAQAELMGRTPDFLECLFADRLRPQPGAITGDALVQRVLSGGFPEAVVRENERRRLRWAQSYLTSTLTRDLREIAELEKLTELPKLVRMLAEHAGQLANYSQFGTTINVNYKTAQRYVRLLEQVFLLANAPPWFNNARKQLVKMPKLHFLDSGLLAAARGLTFKRIVADRRTFGALLENFVFAELLKLIHASDFNLNVFHYRDRDMREVDIVLERDDGMVVGIEVKAGATVRAADFSGLKALARACGERFACGVILYDSTQAIPFGRKLWAAPLSSLWADACQ